MPDDPKITHPKQVIVEGNDEIRVFEALCRHLNIPDVEIRHYGGSPNLKRFLKAFIGSSEFGLVQSLAVVADANLDRDGREQRICGALSMLVCQFRSSHLRQFQMVIYRSLILSFHIM